MIQSVMTHPTWISAMPRPEEHSRQERVVDGIVTGDSEFPSLFGDVRVAEPSALDVYEPDGLEHLIAEAERNAPGTPPPEHRLRRDVDASPGTPPEPASRPALDGFILDGSRMCMVGLPEVPMVRLPVRRACRRCVLARNPLLMTRGCSVARNPACTICKGSRCAPCCHVTCGTGGVPYVAPPFSEAWAGPPPPNSRPSADLVPSTGVPVTPLPATLTGSERNEGCAKCAEPMVWPGPTGCGVCGGYICMRCHRVECYGNFSA